MKRLVFALACVVSLLPQLASAALSLQIGSQSGPNTPDATPFFPSPGPQFFDLIFNETPPADNEGLFAYDLSLRLVRPAGTTGGVRLAGAERTPTDFVLGDDPNASTFSVAASTPDELLINISSNNALFDITQGKKAARVFYTYDVDFSVLGEYRIVFDTTNTVFGSGDPNRPDPAIAVDLSDAGVIRVIPEPASAALLGVAGMLVLRRRKRL